MKKLLTIMLAVLLAALAVAASAEDNVKNADIIIVGAGGGGLSAAIEAGERRRSERHRSGKDRQDGGSLNFTSGSMSGAETVIQKIDGIEDTKESFVQDILNNGAHLGNEAMIRAFVDEDVDAIQWLLGQRPVRIQFLVHEDHGQAYRVRPGASALFRGAHLQAQRQRPDRYKAAAHEIMDTVLATDAYKGVTIDFNTTANQLVANEQGQVLTVLATDENGQTVRYEAKKAVIMATGGYSGNAKMMSAFAKNGANYLVGGSTAADGYGIYMMQQVGANIDPTAMGYIPTFPMGHETAPGMGVIASSYMWKAGGISVNQEGFRFANENDADVVARETALEEQTNAIQYDIFTDKIIEDTEALNASVFWNFYYAPGKPYNSAVISADSLAVLAEKLGIPGGEPRGDREELQRARRIRRARRVRPRVHRGRDQEQFRLLRRDQQDRGRALLRHPAQGACRDDAGRREHQHRRAGAGCGRRGDSGSVRGRRVRRRHLGTLRLRRHGRDGPDRLRPSGCARGDGNRTGDRLHPQDPGCGHHRGYVRQGRGQRGEPV